MEKTRLQRQLEEEKIINDLVSRRDALSTECAKLQDELQAIVTFRNDIEHQKNILTSQNAKEQEICSNLRNEEGKLRESIKNLEKKHDKRCCEDIEEEKTYLENKKRREGDIENLTILLCTIQKDIEQKLEELKQHKKEDTDMQRSIEWRKKSLDTLNKEAQSIEEGLRKERQQLEEERRVIEYDKTINKTQKISLDKLQEKLVKEAIKLKRTTK